MRSNSTTKAKLGGPSFAGFAKGGSFLYATHREAAIHPGAAPFAFKRAGLESIHPTLKPKSSQLKSALWVPRLRTLLVLLKNESNFFSSSHPAHFEVLSSKPFE
jgi:hypothetical protein